MPGYGDLKPAWATLITKFPSRFVIGSDHFFAEGADGNPLPDVWGRNRLPIDAIEAIDPQVAAKVAHENAEAIYRGLE